MSRLDKVNVEGYNNLPTLAERLPQLLDALVRKAAFDIQAQAAKNAPVQTGNLKNSIYTVTHNFSNYESAGNRTDTAVARHNAKHGTSAESDMLPEVEAPTEPAQAIVAVGASYGLYVEYGTSRMGAHPYLVPAIEAVKPKLDEIFGKLEDMMGGGVLTSEMEDDIGGIGGIGGIDSFEGGDL